MRLWFKNYKSKLTLTAIILLSTTNATRETQCSKAYGCSDNYSVNKTTRYILYDVNIGEGFNLKRDVYMRMALFMQVLGKDSKNDWHLILPPWTKQWHWTNEDPLISYQWYHFFDVSSLQLYAPVIELDQFFSDYGDTVDEVYVLQHFPEFYEWTEGSKNIIDWSDRWRSAECRDHPYWKQKNGAALFFRGKKHVKAKNVSCISFQGSSAFLTSVVSSTDASTIMFDRAEISTHSTYGDSNYWMCRRSMRFAKHLIEAANVFRETYLNSSDKLDGTIKPLDWRDERPKRDAKGGPYLGVHLRRKDFLLGRANEIPSLEESIIQIKKYLKQLNLSIVFIASDMDVEEYEYVDKTLTKANIICLRYKSTNANIAQFKEGGLSIIDQIIASHARFFVGTHESTFSYRIQEEREIMGFPAETTFNRFCPSLNGKTCTPPTRWLISYPSEKNIEYTGEKAKYFELKNEL